MHTGLSGLMVWSGRGHMGVGCAHGSEWLDGMDGEGPHGSKVCTWE
jgi:hypothetical protein